jgi:hypothetical protein
MLQQTQNGLLAGLKKLRNFIVRVYRRYAAAAVLVLVDLLLVVYTGLAVVR